MDQSEESDVKSEENQESNINSLKEPQEHENPEDSSPDGKRQKCQSQPQPMPTTPSKSNPIFPNGVPPSPPKFVSLEEIMKAANGVENMVLAHEIAVDKDFRLEKMEPQPNGLEKQVKDMMHRVFWDVLQSQLDENPPNFSQALSLLGEIKENLLSLLLPQHTRLRQEIEEILDLELIEQKAENGILEFERYAQYVLSVCSRLCAPVRDEKIRELTQTTQVVPLFRGIMELLDVMKLDFANFHIQQMRPHIQQHSIQYERKKFQEFLDSQSKMSGVDGLEFTKKWLKRNLEEIDLSSETSNAAKINKILIHSYMELLQCKEEEMNTYPETLLLDASRFQGLCKQTRDLTLLGSIMLVTFANVGAAIQGLQEFREQLKDHLKLIISDEEKSEEDKLASSSVQVSEDVKKCLDKHGFPQLDSTKSEMLNKQITEISNPDNRVRKIVERRILDFVEGVLSSPTAVPLQIPTGLSSLHNELSGIAGQFMRLVGHNRAVFKEYYADIIENLFAGN